MKDFDAARASLVEILSAEIKDERVLAAMSRIPREKFVPKDCRAVAYEDRPLPIGWEQTISQPYIIAYMTAALELTRSEKGLEIGTGSGYQTAILAELARRVVTVERLPALAGSARKVLGSLGYANIQVHLAGETLGWKQGAPYGAILVTAGAPELPDELVEQLAYGGRMVIPIGPRHVQELCKITRLKDGTRVQKLGECCFVALIGTNAWQE